MGRKTSEESKTKLKTKMERKFVNKTKYVLDDFATIIVKWYVPIVIEYATRKQKLSDCTLYGEIQVKEQDGEYKELINIGSIDIMFESNYDVEISYDGFKLSWHEEIGNEMTIEGTKERAMRKVVKFLEVYYYD